jgi:uncharacterized protein (DUF2141 family)
LAAATLAAVSDALVAPSSAAQSGQLVVDVTNLPSDEGRVLVGIYGSPREFPMGRHEFSAAGDIDGGRSRIIIPNVPYGTYAIAVQHDENANGQMDFFMGFP